MVDLSALKYTDKVIHEALRLFPAIPMLSRATSQDIKVGDRKVKKSDELLLCPYVTQRSSQVWGPTADQFDPGRQLPEQPFSFFPFGSGPRRCPGQGLATLEVKGVLLAMVHAGIKLQPSKGSSFPKEALFISLRPKPFHVDVVEVGSKSA